jgi:hypothetical protein
MALTQHLSLDEQPMRALISLFDAPIEGPHAEDMEDWLREHWADDIARDSGLR